ncbi:MAG: DUF6327 family protein [Flavobacterium sp.]
MEIRKKYSTYAEINHDLDILKLEKDIYYEKMFLSIDKTRESLTLPRIVSCFLGSYKTILSESYNKVLSIVIPYIIEWLINRKRGD